MSTKKLINIHNRYDSKRKTSKLSKIGLKKVAKIPNVRLRGNQKRDC